MKIYLKDNIAVDVELHDGEHTNISFGKKLDSSISEIEGILKRIASPVAAAHKQLQSQNKIDSTKIKVGLRITAEGDFVVAKASTQAHLEIEMSFKPE